MRSVVLIFPQSDPSTAEYWKAYAQHPPVKTSQEKPSSGLHCIQKGSSLQCNNYIAQRDVQSLPNLKDTGWIMMSGVQTIC